MLRHGKGILVLKNGGQFEGFWEKDFIIEGKLNLNNGYEYEGKFKNNLIHG